MTLLAASGPGAPASRVTRRKARAEAGGAWGARRARRAPTWRWAGRFQGLTRTAPRHGSRWPRPRLRARRPAPPAARRASVGPDPCRRDAAAQRSFGRDRWEMASARRWARLVTDGEVGCGRASRVSVGWAGQWAGLTSAAEAWRSGSSGGGMAVARPMVRPRSRTSRELRKSSRRSTRSASRSSVAAIAEKSSEALASFNAWERSWLAFIGPRPEISHCSLMPSLVQRAARNSTLGACPCM